MVIGSGLFALPGLAIEATDPFTAFLGWLSVIALMPPMIHVFSFLGRQFPRAGGIALYASHAFGKWSEGGFSLVICGALAVGMPAFFMVGGAYLAELFNFEPTIWQIPLAIVLAIAATAMNIVGFEKLGWVNKFVVISILGLVVMLIILAFSSYNIGTQEFGKHVTEYGINIGDIWLAAAIVFWAFQGWENMSFGLEEFKNPNRSIPIVFWSSFAIISIVYIAFALTATLASMAGEDVAGLSGLTSLMGDGSQRQVMLALTVMVLVANANSWVFGASRAFYSAANQGVLPHMLSKLNERSLPHASLLFTLGLYIIVMLLIWFWDVHAKYAFLLTTQGFIILYGASILAFYKLTKGLFARCVALLALIGWLFLMHGFGWLIVYPAALFLIGVFLKKQLKSPSYVFSTEEN